ncbi:hypothetical protein QYE76_001727 [Lolium multiflorum]|uniref:Uncharacterized protein n=1 Tax=Lolium multiflorum TaxID=4521 RepID=A0AAD8RMN4_LOLMU|nr:hypothetical protein QYE76_001727 [Lolium multiflorum]
MAVIVEITQRTVLRPSSGSAWGDGKKVPLTVFDCASTDGYIPTVFAWNAPAPANSALMDGLLDAVARFPHLAGRFAVDDHGRKCIHLNDAGVLVLEGTAATDLAEALPHDVPAHISELYPDAENGRAGEPLFQVQLTRYTCGGLIIGMVSHHQVADGQSMSGFSTAWATTVRTDSTVLPSPFSDRATTVNPRSPPAPVFDHRNIEFKGEHSSSHSYRVLPMDRIKNLGVHFPEEFVADLKSRVGARCSTFQCLLAHVWKKVTAARDLDPEDFTQVRVAVNCRGRAEPPVPMDFFGNMVLWAFPRMQVRDLLSSGYPAVVGAIREAVARVDDEYVQSFVDFGSGTQDGGQELAATAATPGTSFCPDLEVDSWLGFRFHDMDFGHGPPCAFLPPDLPIDGIMVFVPSCAAKGGVDLFIALDDEHVEAFEHICYSID